MLGSVGLALGGLLVILVVRLLTANTSVPFAVVLVIVGLVYSELPGENLELNPEVVLVLVIPPLLYSAALKAGVLEIRANLARIASLSVGLVLVTALGVGAALSAVVPGLGVAAAVALGAAVAPPDPVAALTIARRAGLPRTLLTLIEGEGLLNDATALTVYEVAVAATVGGGFSLLHGVGRFFLSAVGGVVAGLLVAAVAMAARRRLDDPLVENSLSLATPFAAYALAEAVHLSGVLAVVVAGLLLAHQAPAIESGAARLQTRAVWALADFLLEGFVFLLIGEQFKVVIDGLGPYPAGTVAAALGVTVGAVLVIRPLWLFLSRRLVEPRGAGASTRELIALSWSGTRGVITLAAAFALPLEAHRRAFPDRDLLLLCAYAVVIVTLVGQGLTLAPLLRALGLGTPTGDERQMRAAARVAAIDAALRRLEEVGDEEPHNAVATRMGALYRERRRRAQERLDWVADSPLDAGDEETIEAFGRLRRALLDAEREELVRWRDGGRITDAGFRRLQRELDHEEGILSITADH
ncbi:MAG: Na+/H+ antiporter [Solirubrobacterales bacterium]|nr:Na+/H+ antiporter [Solirubrobacterales bacterium]